MGPGVNAGVFGPEGIRGCGAYLGAAELPAGSGGCDGAAGDLRAGYTAGLRGMDACRRGLLSYPASPLYSRNLADRNVTLLAALLCSLVPA